MQDGHVTCIECGKRQSQLTAVFGTRSIRLVVERVPKTTTTYVYKGTFVAEGVEVFKARRTFWQTRRGWYCASCSLLPGSTFLEASPPAFKLADLGPARRPTEKVWKGRAERARVADREPCCVCRKLTAAECTSCLRPVCRTHTHYEHRQDRELPQLHRVLHFVLCPDCPEYYPPRWGWWSGAHAQREPK